MTEKKHRQAPGHVNNGHRVALELPDFSGKAGFVQRGPDHAHLAYIPNKTGGSTKPGDPIDIMGTSWRVAAREASDYVARMIVLTLEK